MRKNEAGSRRDRDYAARETEGSCENHPAGVSPIKWLVCVPAGASDKTPQVPGGNSAGYRPTRHGRWPGAEKTCSARDHLLAEAAENQAFSIAYVRQGSK